MLFKYVFRHWSYGLRAVLFSLLLVTALPIHVSSQTQPSAEIVVDDSNVNTPLRVSIASSSRKDVAFIVLRASLPTHVVTISTDSLKFRTYPVGEVGFAITAPSDTSYLPVGTNITIARIMTDSATRTQAFDIEFRNRNYESIATQRIVVTVPRSVALAAPCTRSVLDLTTGIHPPTGSLQAIGSIDAGWVGAQGAVTGLPSGSSPLYILSPNSLWLQNSVSHWLGWTPTAGTSAPSGYSTAWKPFCLTRNSVVNIQIRLSADNDLSVYLEPGNILLGTSTLTSNGYGYQTTTNINYTASLTAGTHYLRVVSYNFGEANGFRMNAGSSIQAVGGGAQLGLAGSACCLPLGRIYGWKYWDKNCNGVQDNGDYPLANWQIIATPVAGGPSVTTSTDGSGFYSMALTEGVYAVSETQQSGWTPSTPFGAYFVPVLSGGNERRSFLNCKQPTCEELFTESNSDSVCCTGRFSVSNAGNVALTQLSFVATGGVVVGVNTSCPATTAPNFTGGVANGILTFSPACPSMAVEFDARSTNATGNVCVVWTATFTQGTSTFTCSTTVCINCVRMPKICNNPLQVSPSVFDPTNTDWRTFTLSNVKLPASQISYVDATFNIEPTPIPHYGGGLVVDGVGRPWTAISSNAYTRIRMNCSGTTEPHGAAAVNQVKFNLGVDNTLNYTGIVHLKIGYCDGDTCELDFPWVPRTTRNYPASVDTASFVVNPRFIRMKLLPPDSAGSMSVRLGDSTATILAMTVPTDGLDGYERDKRPQQFFTSEARSSAALVSFDCSPICDPPDQLTLTILYASPVTSIGSVPVSVRYFAKDGSELGQAERVFTTSPTSIVSDGSGDVTTRGALISSIYPSPATDHADVRVHYAEAGVVSSIVVADLQGRVIRTIAVAQHVEAGPRTYTIDTGMFESGMYIVRVTINGVTSTSSLHVLR